LPRCPTRSEKCLHSVLDSINRSTADLWRSGPKAIRNCWLYSGRGAVVDWYPKRQARRRWFECSKASQTSRAEASECEKSVPRLDVAQVTGELQIGCWLHRSAAASIIIRGVATPFEGSTETVLEPAAETGCATVGPTVSHFCSSWPETPLRGGASINTMKSRLGRTHGTGHCAAW
jgi:hypothetical protein